MIPTKEQIAWAAGLIEGDGSLAFRKRKRTGRTPPWDWAQSVRVAMTDRDVLEKICDVFQCGKVYGPYDWEKYMKHRDDCQRQPQYVWTVSSKKDVFRVVELIRPWLCQRRGRKADEVLAGIMGFTPKGEPLSLIS